HASPLNLHPFPTRRSSDLERPVPDPRATHGTPASKQVRTTERTSAEVPGSTAASGVWRRWASPSERYVASVSGCVSTCSEPQIRSEEHTSELQSPCNLVSR